MFINIVNRNYSYTPPVVLSNKSCLRIWPNQLFCRLLRVYIISLCVSVICSNNDWNCLKFLVSDCSNFQLYVSWGERRSLICVQTFVVAKQVRIADDFTRRLIENAARCGSTVHRHVPEDGNCFFHCIQDQLMRVNESDISPSTLRCQLVSFMRQLVRIRLL